MLFFIDVCFGMGKITKKNVSLPFHDEII